MSSAASRAGTPRPTARRAVLWGAFASALTIVAVMAWTDASGAQTADQPGSLKEHDAATVSDTRTGGADESDTIAGGAETSDTSPNRPPRRTAPTDIALRVAAAVASSVLHLGLAAAFGALMVQAWQCRLRVATPSSDTLAAFAHKLLRAAAALCAGALAARGGAIFALNTRLSQGGTGPEILRHLAAEGAVLSFVAAPALFAVLAAAAPKIARSATTLTSWQIGAVLVLLAALGDAAGHEAVVSGENAPGLWVTTLHTTAASLCAGPPLVAALTAARRAWRQRPEAERRATLRRLAWWVAPTSSAALGVFALTGTALAFPDAGKRTLTLVAVLAGALTVAVTARRRGAASPHRRRDRTGGAAPAAKPAGRRVVAALSLIVLAASTLLATPRAAETSPAPSSVDARDNPPTPRTAPPRLGRQTFNPPRLAPPLVATSSPGREGDSSAASAGEHPAAPERQNLADPAAGSAERADTPRSGPSREAAAPSPTTPADGAGDLADPPAWPASLLPGEPAHINDCAAMHVGQGDCYRQYFAAFMRQHGADRAVEAVADAAESHEYVRRDCHQVMHDLGYDAAEWYGSPATAFAYEGYACFSGYYHGVIEHTISDLPENDLHASMGDICTVADGDHAQSFTHWNCIHGLGHGVMVNLDGDLFESVRYCERLADTWQASTCVGGALMENIMTARQGGPLLALRLDDLIYPCNVIAEQYVIDCFNIQPFWIQYQLGYGEENYAESFALCDIVRDDMIDDCYISMGREISGWTPGSDVDRIVRLCSLGRADHHEDCIIGAAVNAVYNDHSANSATALCEATPQHLQGACYIARDYALSTF